MTLCLPQDNSHFPEFYTTLKFVFFGFWFSCLILNQSCLGWENYSLDFDRVISQIRVHVAIFRKLLILKCFSIIFVPVFLFN